MADRRFPAPREYSPFTPGVPVPLDFFVGRKEEVSRLSELARRATAERMQVAFLAGERGIGKSSLATFVRHLAERDHQVLGLHAFLGGVSTLEELVRRVFERLLKDSVDKRWYERIKSFFGRHIQEVGLFGVSVEFGASAADLARLVHDFAPALRNLVERLGNEKRGLLIVLDDINGLAGNADFANWLKSLVDEIATARKPLPLCLLCVGLEQRRQSLIELQPSLARVFTVVDIRAWDESESGEFYRQAFAKVGMTMDDDAAPLLWRYSGGLPVLAHEIGEAVFRVDRDGRIDRQDALEGVMDAAEVVGRKYLDPQVFQAIRSRHYRTILGKLAGDFREDFGRSDLKKKLSPAESRVLDNFLTRMKRLGVIRPRLDAGPGAYQFDNQLHRVYFRMVAERSQRDE